MKLKLITFLMISIVSAIHFSGCSGKEIDESNPQALFDDAEEDVKDKRYLMAVEKFKILKNKHPYSHLATRAQLRLADVYFLEESFVEASGAYETFRDLHPKNEKADYVIFRIGESYFNQLPSSIDRDLTPAIKAIEAYRELHTLYPKSQFLGEAQAHMNESNLKLSKKEKYIGDFYYRRDMYDSASRRYEKITSKYANTPEDEDAYWYWGKSLLFQADQPEFTEKRSALISEARHVYKTYLARYPQGRYSSSISSNLEKMKE